MGNLPVERTCRMPRSLVTAVQQVKMANSDTPRFGELDLDQCEPRSWAAMRGFDSRKAEAFSGRLMGHLNSGAFCLMASVGHRTGLFDAMRDQPPQTSEALAQRAGLHERY